jgi:hypothetical protein
MVMLSFDNAFLEDHLYGQLMKRKIKVSADDTTVDQLSTDQLFAPRDIC